MFYFFQNLPSVLWFLAPSLRPDETKEFGKQEPRKEPGVRVHHHAHQQEDEEDQAVPHALHLLSFNINIQGYLLVHLDIHIVPLISILTIRNI